MHRIRPTLAALASLPRESFDDTVMYDLAVAGNPTDLVEQLRLADLRHPVLDDARRQIERSQLSSHRSSSKAAKQPVYEARQTDGAAWRGAFVRHRDGWWLVHCARHDQFNSLAASQLKAAHADRWLPAALDFDILDAENADLSQTQWEVVVLRALVNCVATAATQSGCAVSHPLPGQPDLPSEDPALLDEPQIAKLLVTVTHDDALDVDPEDSHRGMSLLDLEISMLPAAGRDAGALQNELILISCGFLGVPQEDLSPAYKENGSLEISTFVSHAKLLQLSQDPSGLPAPVGRVAPTRLHFVSKGALTEGYVTGCSVVAICGFTFVPTQDEYTSDGLPICSECETESPSDELIAAWKSGN